MKKKEQVNLFLVLDKGLRNLAKSYHAAFHRVSTFLRVGGIQEEKKKAIEASALLDMASKKNIGSLVFCRPPCFSRMLFFLIHEKGAK